MIIPTETKQQVNSSNRLTIKTVKMATATTTIRSLDWDRDRFDIELGLNNGTT